MAQKTINQNDEAETMCNEIDSLKSEIDKLNALCAELPLRPFATSDNNTKNRQRERIGIWLLKLLDGVLSPRYIAKLEKWLIADADARQYYVDFMTLTTLLNLYYNPDRFRTPIPGELLKK